MYIVGNKKMYYIIIVSYVFHLIKYFCFRISQHQVINNDLMYQAVRVRVCFFLVSYSFGKNYCGEFGLCKYCI